MNKFFVKHSNRLLKSAINVAKNNNLNVVPYPIKEFRNFKEFDNYLNNLTNFISHPELFYASKNSIPHIEIKRSLNISPTYYKNI